MYSFGLVLFAALFRTANAHGYVSSVNVAGQSYDGWLPFTDPWLQPPPSRIVRKVPSDAPILEAGPDLNCHVGGNDPAGATADINAGEQITFTWGTWYVEHIGPFVIHMADCGGSCSSFQSQNARWFTIDQRVLENGDWYNNVFLANGKSFTVTVPASLRAGEYLIRMQLTALHSTGAPQFYPSCTQIRVHGSGNGYPTEGELAQASELIAGYESIDIWASPVPFPIPVPGPGIAAFVHNSSPAPGPSTTTNPVTRTETLGGSTPTHASSLCRRAGRRPRRFRSSGQGVDAVVRNLHRLHGAARSKRHHDFVY